ncbi:NADH-ubiquinone oxidoreductase Complex1 subunit [Trametes polyzona]|nr:NADH-ubiquinone oxidoreductase Complex1 subunit [Trametes polyzona]
MSTIPARLARSARVSSTPEEARKRVIQLYRDWYRSAPEICSLYALNVTPQFVRHCIRNHFEEHRYVTDTRVIDVLIQKGRQEYQETLNCWKQLDHVMGVLLAPRGRPQRTFLQKFYEGRDEDAVLPAATGIVHPKAV